MRSVRMVETPLVFARLATLFLLACAEPPDSAQSPSTRMIRPNLASPAASSPKNDPMPLMTSSSNLGIPTPIPPPHPPPKDILIYGPSLLGAPDNEATLAAAAGHNVTVADPVTWSAMTTADFAQYRAIVFGDPSCQDTPDPTLTVAEANRATWSAAVRGNMVVIGGDPVFHQLQGQANQLTTNAINFAASSAATGLYMSLSCYYFDALANTPVTVLSDFGDFRVQGQVTPPLNGCPNDVTIVAPDHPVVQGIMKPGLDNWFCSIHEAFNAFPVSLGVVVRDTPTALPYVIAGSSPKARLCVDAEEDRGNGEVDDENGGNGQERRLPLDQEGRRTEVRPERPQGHEHRERIEQWTAGHVHARRHRSRHRTGHGPVLAHAARWLGRDHLFPHRSASLWGHRRQSLNWRHGGGIAEGGRPSRADDAHVQVPRQLGSASRAIADGSRSRPRPAA